jgi:hypothetical protein
VSLARAQFAGSRHDGRPFRSIAAQRAEMDKDWANEFVTAT